MYWVIKRIFIIIPVSNLLPFRYRVDRFSFDPIEKSVMRMT